MRRRVTAREVAERVGVSRTTVSFVLNDVPGMRISEETRQRVLQAAADLDYHPNISARRLVTGQTNILAYVQREAVDRAFSDGFWPLVLRGAHDSALASGYEVLFAPAPAERDRNRCMGLLQGHHADGIILSGPRSDDEELRQLIEAKAPIVIQGSWPGGATVSVDIDNAGAAQEATEHLMQLGHDRVGMIVHAPAVDLAGRARLEGYRAALAAHGKPFDPELVSHAVFTPASGEAALEALLEVEEPPTAIFASSDAVAIGAMRAARRRGMRIPHDLAVVGFDDAPMTSYTEPALTTIRLPAYALGWGAAQLLQRVLTRETIQEPHLRLETELIVRGSCGSQA